MKSVIAAEKIMKNLARYLNIFFYFLQCMGHSLSLYFGQPDSGDFS